jgi:2-methylisocitrate lyase-like PEP mutase family enzyme
MRTMSSQAEKAARFRALHEGRPFVIPNPWDAGSARVLQALGFEALATSSGAFAFTLGRADGEVSLPGLRSEEEIGRVCEAVGLPVNVLALPGLTLAQVFDAGAQRVSVGSGLAWIGVEAMASAAEAMRDQGDLSSLVGSRRIRERLGG